MPQNFTQLRTPRSCFLPCNKDSVWEHPRQRGQQTKKLSFDDIKCLGVYLKGLGKIFRYCWDLSGGCLLTAHLENKSLDWGIWRRSYWLNWGILLYNPEAFTPGCTSPAGWSMEPQISALQSNKQRNHKILLRQKLKEWLGISAFLGLLVGGGRVIEKQKEIWLKKGKHSEITMLNKLLYWQKLKQKKTNKQTKKTPVF